MTELHCIVLFKEFDSVGDEVEIDRITVWLDPLDATQEYTEGNPTTFVNKNKHISKN